MFERERVFLLSKVESMEKQLQEEKVLKDKIKQENGKKVHELREKLDKAFA